MRKLILTLIMTLILNLGLKCQNYIPFPTENVYWNIYLEYSISESPTDTVLLRYTLNGDTTLNEITYKKLCLESGDLLEPSVEPIGGLRENDKKIYFIGKDFLGYQHDQEILLYNFNKQIGDTVKHDKYEIFYSVIENIDSVEIDGIYRKRYKVKSNNNYYFKGQEYWIEGIGSINNGLLGHITMIPTCCYHFWEHICFNENGQVKYLNPSFTECFPSSLLPSITKIESEASISLYPNPTEKYLIIENNTNSINQIIRIIDTEGRIQSQGFLTERKTTIEFPVSQGVYYVLIYDNKGEMIKREKIIKQ